MKYDYFPVGDLAANCCLVYDDKGNAVVIDPGDKSLSILEKIEWHGIDVQAVLLTHGHFDHMGAAADVQFLTESRLYVHADDERALTDPVYSVMPLEEPLTADVLVHDGDTLQIGDLTFTVLHTPGHTPGSVCYLCDGVLFAGDTLFAGSIGRTDFAGGDVTAMRQSLRRLAALPDETVVIPGHGEKTTIGAEKQTNPFMLGL